MSKYLLFNPGTIWDYCCVNESTTLLIMRNQTGKHLCALLLVMLIGLMVKGQQWEKDFPVIPRFAKAITELQNEDLVFMDDSLVQCVSKLGNPKWDFSVYDLAASQSFLLSLATAENGDLHLIAQTTLGAWIRFVLSPQGNLISETPILANSYEVADFLPLPGGESILLAAGVTGQLTRLDTLADTVWTYNWVSTPQLEYEYYDVSTTFDGGFLMVGKKYDYPTSTGATSIVKIDALGNLLWEKNHYNIPSVAVKATSVAQAPDSTFLLKVELQALSSFTEHQVISPTGDSLNSYPFINGWAETRFVPTADGNVLSYFVNGYNLGRIGMTKLMWPDSILWSINRATGNRTFNIRQIISLADSGFAVVGATQTIPGGNFLGAFVARYDSRGLPYGNLLYGMGYYDINGNCILDTNEVPVPNMLLTLSGDTSMTFSSYSNGQFHQPLESGTFQIGVAGGSNFWGTSPCYSPPTINFPSNSDSQYVEIPLTPVYACVDLEVDISSPILRVCFPGFYTVNYSNAGTAPAANAYIDIELPPSITFDSASIAHTLLPSGQYRFDLDSIQALEVGSFNIFFTVDCPADPLTLLGNTECATAHIYPDSICLPTSPNWDGSDIEVETACYSTDSVRFVVRNVSNAAMTVGGNYLVLEDNILRTNSPFQLPGNDSIVFFRTANGSTWTLTAPQSAGHPTSVAPLSSLEGCGLDSSGGYSKGILPQMPQDDSDGSISIFCSTYLGSYDPNDKRALPTGLGDFREIEVEEEIDYMIRFQNTGTFPAQNVVIIDTLDPNLDWTTLDLVSASHPYTWQLKPGGVLEVTFANINLPDSTNDEPNSHGFVKLSIYPDSTLQPGDMFRNRAEIYFDFNPAVITNMVFHTISSQMFGIVSIDEAVEGLAYQLEAYPNPFKEEVHFRTEELLGPGATFTMLDIRGNTVHQQRPGRVKEFTVSPPSLPAGLYFFRLQDETGRSAHGKLILKP